MPAPTKPQQHVAKQPEKIEDNQPAAPQEESKKAAAVVVPEDDTQEYDADIYYPGKLMYGVKDILSHIEISQAQRENFTLLGTESAFGKVMLLDGTEEYIRRGDWVEYDQAGEPVGVIRRSTGLIGG